MQVERDNCDSKHLSKLQDGWGFGSANHPHSSVIGFLGLLISLSDLATGLLDPILVLGGSVVLGDFLVDQGLAEGFGRSPPIVHAGQTGPQEAVLAMVSAWALAAMSSVVRSDRPVGRRDGAHLVVQLLSFGGAEVSRKPSGGLRVLGVRACKQRPWWRRRTSSASFWPFTVKVGREVGGVVVTQGLPSLADQVPENSTSAEPSLMAAGGRKRHRRWRSSGWRPHQPDKRYRRRPSGRPCSCQHHVFRRTGRVSSLRSR